MASSSHDVHPTVVVRHDGVRSADRCHDPLHSLLLEGVRGLAIVILDPDGRVVSSNRAVTHLTGFPAEEIRALSLVSWVPLLLDGRDPVPGSYQSYVGAWSVLLPPAASAPCDPAGWRPWLRPEPLPHVPACRACLGEGVEPFVRLPWQLPVMAQR